MFGGLEIKGGSEKKKEEETPPPATTATTTTTSGFSFLSSPAPDPVSSSGFSFLSSSIPADTDVNNNTEEIEGGKEEGKEEESSDVPPSAASGFSFLSSTVTNATTTATATSNQQQQQQKEETEEKSEISNSKQQDNPVPSGFSFLSSMAGLASAVSTSVDTAEIDADADTDIPTSTSATDAVSVNTNTSNNSSMFSMLNLKHDEPPAPPATSTWGTTAAPTPTPTTATPPPPPLSTTSSDDILSLSNSNLNSKQQPNGAITGITFGGAARPKAVKKRSRTKKIGAGAGTLSNSIPMENSTSASNSIPPLPPNEDAKEGTEQQQAQAQEATGEGTASSSSSSFQQLSNEANLAASRAEDFLKHQQKQQLQHSNSTNSYAGRYSGTSTSARGVIEEDYGDDGNDGGTNGNASASASASANGKHKAEESEDYKKAKAIAQEAMKKESTLRKTMGMGGFSVSGGFTGFFKRNLSGSRHGPTEEDVHAHATHVMEKKDEVKVPSYGESKSPPSLELESGDDRRESERNRERLREEEQGKRQKRYQEEVEDQQQNLRMEVERQEQEGERNKMERLRQMRLEEEERLNMEMEIERKEREDNQRRQRQEEEEAATRTPEQLLQNILHEFSEKSQHATLAVATLRQERSTMLEKRACAEKQERLATQQISQAEKQQMEAAEKEEFELADQLAAVIEEHQSEQEENAQVFEHIVGLIEDLDFRRLDVVKGLWKCFVHVQDLLKAFLKEQEHSDIIDCSDIMKKFESDTKKLGAEYERLSADLKNIERDEEFAIQEREELESNIHEQTSGIEELRDIAKEELDGINSEIEELRRQLEAKEMEAAEVKLVLYGHEDSIEQVRVTFSRQSTRLVKKESAVNESRNEWNVEDAIYKRTREEHEAEVTAHSEKLVAHDKIISRVREEIDVANELAKIVAQKVVVEKSSDPEHVDDDLRKAQADVLQMEAVADEANQVLAAAKTSISGLIDSISAIELRLPILESEKKFAASERDFKAAAKASKEIKELSARKDRCNDELEGEASDKEKAAQKAVEDALEELNNKKAIAHLKEKDSGSRRMIQLVKKIIDLEKLRENVCGIDEGEMENVKAVGGFVLDSEISALMMEGDDLDQKYGGWNEIMLEYACKENDDDEQDDDADVDVDVDGEIDPSNDESKEIVHSDEEEQDECIEPIEIVADDDQVVDSGVTKEVAMVVYMTMLEQLEDLESKLEVAIENEEYEDAADLDDKIAGLKSGIDLLRLNDAEKEIARTQTNGENVEVVEKPTEALENGENGQPNPIVIAGPSGTGKVSVQGN